MKRKRKNNLLAIVILLVILLFLKLGNLVFIILFVGAVGWIVSSITTGQGKRFQSKSLEQLTKMNQYDFEGYVGNVYRKLGYTVMQTPKSRDGGKDLIMYKGGQTYYVEVKRFKNKPVGRPLIQQLAGASYPAGAKPIFVTTSRFTAEAIAEAKLSKVELIDGKKLISMSNF